MEPSSPHHRRLDALLVTLAVVGALARVNVVEDAWISLRYGRNLAAGHGLVFNPGQWVDGYSNPLWTLYGALPHLLGVDPVPWLHAASIASLLALLAAQRLLAQHMGLSDAAMRGATVLLLAFPSTLTWATSGLEAMPFAAAVTGLAAVMARGEGGRAAVAAAALSAAVCWLRIDGAAWAGSAGALGLALRVAEGRALGPALAAWAGGAAAWGAWAAWHVATYGALTPNVARAKLHGPEVWARGADDAAFWAVLTITPLVAVVGALSPPMARARVALVAAWAVAAVAADVAAGGDYMAHSRYLVPSTPFVALLAARALATLRAPLQAAAWPLLAALSALPALDLSVAPHAVLHALQPTGRPWDDTPRRLRAGRLRAEAERPYLEAEAAALSWVARPGETAVTAKIGRVGYVNPDVRLIDLCGLVTRTRRRDHGPLNRPGHDSCTGPGSALALEPEVLLWKAFPRVPGTAGKVQAWMRDRAELIDLSAYAPVMVAATLPELGDAVVVAARRVEDPVERAAARAAFFREGARLFGTGGGPDADGDAPNAGDTPVRE